jgi:NAD(P)-dependent dehydrogenase (short-subunit alcohol dehydrogenase family)
MWRKKVSVSGKNVLITGGAKRVGRTLSLAAARAGANVILHYAGSAEEATNTKKEVEELGRQAHLVRADFGKVEEAAGIIEEALKYGPLYALVNNAAIFENRTVKNTDLTSWELHMRINLTAPFLLSQAYAKSLSSGESGRIINILDWRALRPGPDHLPYTISKAGLAALTRSLAVALAPNITVNGLALGAILPPSTGAADHDILEAVPAARWANLEEVEQAFLFLLNGPAYITGEIIHLDGGRHLV